MPAKFTREMSETSHSFNITFLHLIKHKLLLEQQTLEEPSPLNVLESTTGNEILSLAFLLSRRFSFFLVLSRSLSLSYIRKSSHQKPASLSPLKFLFIHSFVLVLVLLLLLLPSSPVLLFVSFKQLNEFQCCFSYFSDRGLCSCAPKQYIFLELYSFDDDSTYIEYEIWNYSFSPDFFEFLFSVFCCRMFVCSCVYFANFRLSFIFYFFASVLFSCFEKPQMN